MEICAVILFPLCYTISCMMGNTVLLAEIIFNSFPFGWVGDGNTNLWEMEGMVDRRVDE